MLDQYGREIDYMRISITDRCNLRCVYCMPSEGIVKQCHNDILSYEEITKLVRHFAAFGIRKIKLTGGEPLVRNDVAVLIRKLYEIEGIQEVTLTTNGVLLEDHMEELYEAGLRHINISLDSLQPAIFQKITRFPGADKVKKAISHALSLGMQVKVNVLPIRGYNEDSLMELVELAREHKVHVRFIELMPIGLGASMIGVAQEEIMTAIQEHFGKLTRKSEQLGNGPCVYYACEGLLGSIGFISALSHKFCEHCNRIRLTANGFLKPCLQYDTGEDLRPYLEEEEALHKVIEEVIYHKPRAHAFGEEGQHKEQRLMSDIGG